MQTSAQPSPIRRALAGAAVLAIALSPGAASAQSVEGEAEPQAEAPARVQILVLETPRDEVEASDAGVISSCSLYYGNIVVDCSHLGTTRQTPSDTVPSFIEPTPTVSSRLELYPQRIPPSALAPSRLTASPLPGSAFAASELTAVRSGFREPTSSLYVEPFDPARAYVSR